MTLEKSAMYDWRVRALVNWIEANKQNGLLSMEQLSAAGHLDQYHYLGLEANEQVIKILGLNHEMRILDVGCGIGGPARYIAWKSGASIVGIDIQKNLVDCGNSVSNLVHMDNLVSLVCGDVVDYAFDCSFDAFISLLVILHIEQRAALFAALMRSIKPGGGFLIEDMIALDAFGPEETRIAKEVIGAPNLPTIDEYTCQLSAAGWVDIQFEPLTNEWTRWCIERADQYSASKAKQVELHGEDIFKQRESFYADVKKLFLSGKLGGVRITGRKPTAVESALRKHRSQNGEQSRSMPTSTILETSK